MYNQPPQGYPQTPRPSYPQQQPLYGQPAPGPKKRSRRRFWIIIGVIIALVVIWGMLTNGGNGSQTASSTPTVAPTHATTSAPTHTHATTSAPTHTVKATPTKAPPKVVTLKSFSGHLSGGNWYDTAYFVVPANWQVSWTCQNGDDSLRLVTIAAYDHSGNPLTGDDDIAARGMCSDGAGIGAIQKHGGTIHLHIYEQGDWSVTVQVYQ